MNDVNQTEELAKFLDGADQAKAALSESVSSALNVFHDAKLSLIILAILAAFIFFKNFKKMDLAKNSTPDPDDEKAVSASEQALLKRQEELEAKLSQAIEIISKQQDQLAKFFESNVTAAEKTEEKEAEKENPDETKPNPKPDNS